MRGCEPWGTWANHWWREHKVGYWRCGECGFVWPMTRIRITNGDTGDVFWEDRAGGAWTLEEEVVDKGAD